jgi:hypothetical protein
MVLAVIVGETGDGGAHPVALPEMDPLPQKTRPGGGLCSPGKRRSPCLTILRLAWVAVTQEPAKCVKDVALAAAVGSHDGGEVAGEGYLVTSPKLLKPLRWIRPMYNASCHPLLRRSILCSTCQRTLGFEPVFIQELSGTCLRISLVPNSPPRVGGKHIRHEGGHRRMEFV